MMDVVLIQRASQGESVMSMDHEMTAQWPREELQK